MRLSDLGFDAILKQFLEDEGGTAAKFLEDYRGAIAEGISAHSRDIDSEIEKFKKIKQDKERVKNARILKGLGLAVGGIVVAALGLAFITTTAIGLTLIMLGGPIGALVILPIFAVAIMFASGVVMAIVGVLSKIFPKSKIFNRKKDIEENREAEEILGSLVKIKRSFEEVKAQVMTSKAENAISVLDKMRALKKGKIADGSLDFRGQAIGDLGLSIICRSLIALRNDGDLPSNLSLDLSHCKITDDGLKELIAYVKTEGNKIVGVELTGNNLSEKSLVLELKGYGVKISAEETALSLAEQLQIGGDKSEKPVELSEVVVTPDPEVEDAFQDEDDNEERPEIRARK